MTKTGPTSAMSRAHAIGLRIIADTIEERDSELAGEARELRVAAKEIENLVAERDGAWAAVAALQASINRLQKSLDDGN